MTSSDDRLWTADEVARYLGIHVQTVYRKVRAGTLSVVRVGRLMRFRPEDVRAERSTS